MFSGIEIENQSQSGNQRKRNLNSIDPENTKTVSQECVNKCASGLPDTIVLGKRKRKKEISYSRNVQNRLSSYAVLNYRIQFANAVTCENIKETLHICLAQLEEKA